MIQAIVILSILLAWALYSLCGESDANSKAQEELANYRRRENEMEAERLRKMTECDRQIKERWDKELNEIFRLKWENRHWSSEVLARSRLREVGLELSNLKGKYSLAIEKVAPEYRAMAKTLVQLRSDEQNAREAIAEAKRFRRQHNDDQEAYGRRVKTLEDMLHADKSTPSMSWLSEQYADFFDWSIQKVEMYLEIYRKAYSSAQTVRNMRAKMKEEIKSLRIYKLRSTYYEKMFPFLADLIADDEAVLPANEYAEYDQADAATDEAARWLSAEEYGKLSETERNQRALDRYGKRRKTSWEIGRDYEAYIGHMYSQDGYHVEYFG